MSDLPSQGDVMCVGPGEQAGEREAVGVGDQVVLAAELAPVNRAGPDLIAPKSARSEAESQTARERSRRPASTCRFSGTAVTTPLPSSSSTQEATAAPRFRSAITTRARYSSTPCLPYERARGRPAHVSCPLCGGVSLVKPSASMMTSSVLISPPQT
jgi:hypothetical protein